MTRLSKFLAVLVLAGTATQGQAEMTSSEIRDGYKVHAALAQYYRWFQIYERGDGGIANALDILSEDVQVSSSLGTANGHDEYAARVAQLPETWSNAHKVSNPVVTVNADGTMTLTATVLYQNLGMLEEGAVRQAELAYKVALEPKDGGLPLVSSVEITPVREMPGDAYADAYPENRLRSLAHAWLSFVEDPARNPEPFRALLADEFVLNFSSGPVTDFAAFEAWLAGPASQVAASTHTIEAFSVTAESDDLFTATMDIDWAGVLPDGTELVAKTRHNWTVTNDVTEPFARIKTMDVEILEPFRPKGS